MLLYIGPGMSIATIVIVAIILILVVASLLIVLIRPLKRWVANIKNLFGDK